MPNPDPSLEPAPPASVLDTPASTTPVKLCLLVVFNHRYDSNLPKLDWMYRSRFKHIRYLMPFYRGHRSDVIAVAHSSFQFQGFFLEAWNRLRGEGFTHFVFVADDMVLNPRLNEQNFLEALRIDPRYGYFKHISSLADLSLNWFPTASGLVAVAGTNGVNWQEELPPFEADRANLEAKGYPMHRLGWHYFQGGGPRAKGFFQFLFFLVLRGRLVIEMRDARVELRAGELFVVPKGVEHRTVAHEEAHLLLIEPTGTPNTGDAATAAVRTLA